VTEATQPTPTAHGGERARLVALPGGQSGSRGRPPLPSEVSSFVGREDELGEIVRLLRAHRLVTLTGVGGSGKTRLALAVAGELAEIFADGLWVVELAPAGDPELVPRVVAAAADIGERPGQPLTETLTEVLRSRTALLVLDNCEHLIDACAALAGALLRACPGVRILATSRQALGMAGEVTYRVPSLALPASTPAEAGEEAVELERMARYAAVRLFVERASFGQPGFALSAQNVAAVVQVCRRLDGIPLALELAAARVRVLTPEQLAARLDDRFRLLTAGPRTALPHQQTLRATLDWSYALLSEPEQALLRRLAVFAGG
jgi:predicted ATPase